MTDKEKKAIDYLMFHEYENSSTKEDMIDIVLELIEKQQKEIEELKNEIEKQYIRHIQQLDSINNILGGSNDE